MKKGKFVINFLVVFILIAVGVISYRALEKKLMLIEIHLFIDA